MKVHIDECYVECDICKQKIDHTIFFNHTYQIKVNTVERDGIKPYRKIDLCSDCYRKFKSLICKELKEAEDKKNEESNSNSSTEFTPFSWLTEEDK